MSDTQTLLVGIDCGERQYDVCALHRNSRFRLNFATGITRSDRERISRRICEAASKTAATDVVVSIECSTPSSHILADYLAAYDWPKNVKVTTRMLPTPTPRFLAKASLVETKTDSIDAYTCAQCGQYQDLPQVKRTSKELKAYCAEYILLTKHIAATKQHIRSSLMALNPVLPQRFRNAHEGTLLWVMIDCFACYREEGKLDLTSLDKILAKCKFRMTPARKQLLLDTINQETINENLYIVESLKRLYNVLTTQEVSVRRTKRQIAKTGGQSEIAKLLTTIPGIGDFTAAVAVGIIQDLGRFESEDKLVGYVGTYPVLDESCGKGRKNRMCRKGVKILKKLLWTSAMTAVNTNEYVRRIFRKAISRGLKKKAAYGVIMTRLVRWIFGVWKSEQPWRHTEKEQVEQDQPQACKNRKERGQHPPNACSSPTGVITSVTKRTRKSKRNHQISPGLAGST